MLVLTSKTSIAELESVLPLETDPRAVRGRSTRGKEKATRCHGSCAYVWNGRPSSCRHHPVRPMVHFHVLAVIECHYSLGATSCYVTEYAGACIPHEKKLNSSTIATPISSSCAKALTTLFAPCPSSFPACPPSQRSIVICRHWVSPISNPRN